MKIKLIQQLKDLDGGQFLEIFPGPYKGRSWNEQSVYIEDNAFALIESIVKQHVPKFDHRSNVGISKESWEAIINDLQALKNTLANASSADDVQGKMQFRDGTVSSSFNASFQENSSRLIVMIDELSAWLKRELESQSVVSVLGI